MEKLKAVNWWVFFFMFISVTIALLMFLLSILLIESDKTDAEYIDAKLIDVEEGLCPGDIMTFEYTVAIHDKPIILRVVETWYDPAINRSVSQSYAYRLVIRNEIGTWTQRQTTIVPNIDPGNYLYRRGLDQSTKYASIFELPVTVIDCE